MKQKSVRKKKKKYIYKPKRFYTFFEDGVLLIKEKFEEEDIGIPSKIEILFSEKKIRIRRYYFFSKEIKFEDIRLIESSISFEYIEVGVSYLVGKVYLTKVNGRRVKLFSIAQKMTKSSKLIEKELQKDLKEFERILKAEINKK